MKSILNTEEWLSKPRIIAGVMTGTSLDAIDVSIVRFYKKEGRLKFSVVNSGEFPLNSKLRRRLLSLMRDGGSAKDFSQLNYVLPEYFADAVNKVLIEKRLSVENLDGIGIHGQTLWHQPNYEEFGGIHIRSTLQSGSGSVLATHMGVPVVSDFRAADVAAGGQGAPLVPIFDYEFLSHPEEDTIALNIGGIANITFLPAGKSKSKVVAFDTGPGNMLIDMAMQKFYKQPFDKDGSTAQRGWNFQMLYDYLISNPYIIAPPPKSTGREMFNSVLLEVLDSEQFKRQKPKDQDIIRTLTDFTVGAIAENIKRYANPRARIIVSGGGAKNKFMMLLLAKALPAAKILMSDKIGMPSDEKEAICFAYLAYRTLGGLASNVPRATGAKKDVILGSISIPMPKQ